MFPLNDLKQYLIKNSLKTSKTHKLRKKMLSMKWLFFTCNCLL